MLSRVPSKRLLLFGDHTEKNWTRNFLPFFHFCLVSSSRGFWTEEGKAPLDDDTCSVKRALH